VGATSVGGQHAGKSIAAFDFHLIGVDPDFRIHVSDRLLEIHDGPFLTRAERNRWAGDRTNGLRIALIATGWRYGSQFKKTASKVSAALSGTVC